MKFLVDQQLPRLLAAWIRAQGYEARHIREIGMEHAEDRAIWREAISRGADGGGFAERDLQKAGHVQWLHI